MDTLVKFFPFMPAKDDAKKLLLAILFYVGVGTLGGGLLAIIIFPLCWLMPTVGNLYMVIGVVFTVLSYTGYGLPGQAKEAE